MAETLGIVRQGFMITGFVLTMMLVIEYLNVLTRGNWDRIIGRWTWGQSALCSFLGATPGCLGAYVAASLYLHRVVTIGALAAAMVATCGDEAFVMLALFPRTALAIFCALFLGGALTGVVVDLVTRARRTRETPHLAKYRATHAGHPECIPFSAGELLGQWRRCSPRRGWLTLLLVAFLAGVLSGTIGHDHAHETEHDASPAEHVHHEGECDHGHAAEQAPWDWVRVTLAVLGGIALLIVATVPDHFLDEHLWHHLIRIHGWRVLLWTLGALAVTHLLVNNVDVGKAVDAHRLPVLLLACLVGLLPTSGPHLVFVTLYAEGALPLSTLVANCIVQDGHGLIPTLAHSRRAFLAVKAIKLAIGLGVGVVGQMMGW